MNMPQYNKAQQKKKKAFHNLNSQNQVLNTYHMVNKYSKHVKVSSFFFYRNYYAVYYSPSLNRNTGVFKFTNLFYHIFCLISICLCVFHYVLRLWISSIPHMVTDKTYFFNKCLLKNKCTKLILHLQRRKTLILFFIFLELVIN